MRLSFQILFTLLLVALVPLSVSGLTSLAIAEEAITDTARENLTAEARHLAELSETTILGAARDLSQASTLRFDRLRGAELTAALGIIYREDVRRNAVALIDGATGEPVADLVYQEEVADEPGLRGHAPFAEEDLEAFATHIPLAEAVRAGRAISLPFADEARGLSLIALAVRVDGPPGADGKPKAWVVAVEFSLAELNQRFEEAGHEGVRAFLVDLEGRAVCHTDVAVALTRQDMSAHPGVQRLRDPMATSAAALPHQKNDEWLSAFARAERLASPTGQTWGVVIERRTDDVLARVKEMTSRTAFWVGTALLLALLGGIILSRGIARPLEVLTKVVGRFGSGDQQARATVHTKNEIGSLAGAFNQMADAIDERDQELRAFNQELQVRVDERTRELKDAQDELLRSQKAAAVGELGAGVAHEINNPLAAVLGATQLMLLRMDKDSPHYESLKDVEQESLRIKDIVESLLKLSRDQGPDAKTLVDANEVVESALALVARPIIAQRIQVKRNLAAKLPRLRGAGADLQQMLMALMLNAKEAMPDGGQLTITTENVDDKLVKITVEDTGRGIPEQNLERVFEPFFTTRAADGHKGMGLSLVQKVVEDNGGRVQLESRVGKGTQVKVVFPAAREGTHLA